MTAHILSATQLDRLLINYPVFQESSKVLLDSSILNLLASTGRKSLAKLVTEHQYVPGEIIMREGEPGDAMYIILSGQVAVIKGGFEAPVILSCRRVGEIIGEMALIENQPRFASVIALEVVRLLRISRENFTYLLASDPRTTLKISEVLSRRLRAADEALANRATVQSGLAQQISELKTEKQQLLELQHLQQETTDLIVHDLRNPLSLISGAIDLLEMSLPEDVLQANREILDLARTNCTHMKRLVTSLLDVTQMEEGQVSLLLTSANLPDLIQKTMDRMLAVLKRMNQITIQVSLPPDLPPLIIDEEKIERVLANLMDNAVKHSPDEAEIVVSAELKEGEVWVSVTNPGRVISPEDRERIFDRFGRAAQPHSGRSFGLGLAFCRLAVEAHGGRIWTEPDEAETGNRFVFSLPVQTIST